MNIERLRQLLDYDPETGVLTWRARPEYTGKRAAWNVKYAGQVAGTPIVAGYNYVMIRLNKKQLLAHRIAWAIMTGKWPDREVDHIDGNPANNSWGNLRLATHRQNLHNSRRPRNNTSGFKGVSFYRPKGMFRAYITTDGRQAHLGYFSTPEDAHAAYGAAAKTLRGEFARIA